MVPGVRTSVWKVPSRGLRPEPTRTKPAAVVTTPKSNKTIGMPPVPPLSKMRCDKKVFWTPSVDFARNLNSAKRDGIASCNPASYGLSALIRWRFNAGADL